MGASTDGCYDETVSLCSGPCCRGCTPLARSQVPVHNSMQENPRPCPDDLPTARVIDLARSILRLEQPTRRATLGPNSANEPMAEKFSIERGRPISRHGFGQLDTAAEVRDLPHELCPHDGSANGEGSEVGGACRGPGVLRRPRRGMGSSGEAGEAHRGGRGRRRRRGDGAQRRGFHRPSSPADTRGARPDMDASTPRRGLELV